MKLKQLQEAINSMIDGGLGDMEVMITTQDISVGPRASSPVKSIMPGFDWEMNQIRIEPQIPLIKNRGAGVDVDPRLFDDPQAHGLLVKYLVHNKKTGKLVEDCFVLRPDRDLAAIHALRTYAAMTPNRLLAEDILAWIKDLEKKIAPPAQQE